jgi:putative ABC transport system permease protein
VKSVVISGNETEIYFNNLSTIYSDMPEVAILLNVDESQIQYHDSFLARRFVFSPDEKPPLLWGFYAVILILACISLILIIRSAFQFSMNARMHQMGILHSIGATPKQIRLVLLQEALALSAAPVLFGTIFGIGLCVCFLRYANSITARLQISGAVFEYHYLLFFITIMCSFATILLSAWLPARKLSKISPLMAIKGEYEAPVRRIKKFRLLSAVFGTEGELAGKSFYTRRKAFRTASICLTLSFLAVSMFLVFMTLSEISTGHTYWERYKDAWDIMIEIKNPDMSDHELLSRLRDIDGIDTLIAYRKNKAYTVITANAMSDEINALGGYGALNNSAISPREGTYLVETAIIALDNESYEQYKNVVAAGNAGEDQASAIVVNTIWNSKNSRFRREEYIPFLKQTMGQALKLFFDSDSGADNEAGEIAVAAYAEKAPNLREEYKNYVMVQIVPQNTYERLIQKLPISDKTQYITIRAVSDDLSESIQNQCASVIGFQYEYTIENRSEKAKVNADMYTGYKSIMIAVCGLLACIGLANVAANALGYMFQRKREFARYQSIGLTPAGIFKMLCVEVFVIGVIPLLVSVPFNVLFILFAVNQSAIDMSEFIARMPVKPTLSFAFVMLSAIALSYYIGSRQMKGYNIADALKDDTLY